MSIITPEIPVASLDFAIGTTDSNASIFEAAEFLSTSEQHLNDLLNSGHIAFRQVGNQRVVSWETLRKYEQDRKRGFAALAELVQVSQEMGLYDMTPDDMIRPHNREPKNV